MGWLGEFALGIALRIGLPFLVELLKSKLGVGIDNPVVDAFCQYQQDHRQIKAQTKSRIREARKPRDMIGGNR